MSLTDRCLAVRDRWLANPRFQRWAAAFPLSRPTARRRARALFDVCAGFVYSQILFACVRLKLFDLLALGPQTVDAIAVALQVPMKSTERLLEAAVSLRLVEKRSGERFGLGPLGAAMVGNPAVSAMVLHHQLLYADLHDPVSLLRGEHGETQLARYWAYAGAAQPAAVPSASTVPYTTLMGASLPLVADEILDAYSVDKHRCLLDVGGGDGSFLIAAATRCATLQLQLFDLPPVADRAAQRFTTAGLASRARAVGGSFLSQALPRGADLVSLVRVIHDHDDAPAAALLRAVHDALPPKGVVLLAEPMMGTPGAETVGDAYFGFYLLAMGSGRARTPQELRRMLAAAGFVDVRMIATRQPLQSRLIVASKPA